MKYNRNTSIKEYLHKNLGRHLLQSQEELSEEDEWVTPKLMLMLLSTSRRSYNMWTTEKFIEKEEWRIDLVSKYKLSEVHRMQRDLNKIMNNQCMNNMEGMLTTSQLATKLEISVRKIRYWEKTGYIKASLITKSNQRRYKLEDVKEKLDKYRGKTTTNIKYDPTVIKSMIHENKLLSLEQASSLLGIDKKVLSKLEKDMKEDKNSINKEITEGNHRKYVLEDLINKEEILKGHLTRNKMRYSLYTKEPLKEGDEWLTTKEAAALLDVNEERVALRKKCLLDKIHVWNSDIRNNVSWQGDQWDDYKEEEFDRISTLKSWISEGLIAPDSYTLSGHSRYKRSTIIKVMNRIYSELSDDPAYIKKRRLMEINEEIIKNIKYT